MRGFRTSSCRIKLRLDDPSERDLRGNCEEFHVKVLYCSMISLCELQEGKIARSFQRNLRLQDRDLVLCWAAFDSLETVDENFCGWNNCRLEICTWSYSRGATAGVSDFCCARGGHPQCSDEGPGGAQVVMRCSYILKGIYKVHLRNLDFVSRYDD